MGGPEEGLAASQLLDSSDPSRLSSAEIRDSWGTCENFMNSYGLKPWDGDDARAALSISRAMKAADAEDAAAATASKAAASSSGAAKSATSSSGGSKGQK